MLKVFRPIKIILLVVIFMVLAVFASVNYNTNQEHKEEMQKSFVWVVGDKIISTFLAGLNFASSFSLNNEAKVSNKEDEKDNKKNFFTEAWQDFNNKISNISLSSFFDKFKKENLNLQIKESVKDVFIDELGQEDITVDLNKDD